MIRVGFLINFSEKSWIGGVNYYENLLNAICSLKDRKIDPVIFTGSKADLKMFKGFPPIEIIQAGLLDDSGVMMFLRNGYKRVFAYDLFFERLLLKHKIALSHSGFIGKNARIPAIGWIPDFQHRHLPDFFTKEEIAGRDLSYKRICDLSTCIIVSSYSAQKDLADFAPDCISKSRVLRFAANVGEPDPDPGVGELERRYGFKAPYFYLPNQFWAHKNHRVVIDALSLLKKSGRNVLVLATGNTHDYRQPGYFKELMAYAGEKGISTDSFKPLGLLPRADVVALMKHSVSLINPSLFEGWSTSVEEAKSMGKRIILSDLPVHREQDPPGGIFFDPKNPVELSEAMLRLLSKPDQDPEKMAREAGERLPARMQEFARMYEEIALEVIDKKIA